MVRVGTAGWSYPDWEGIVYPKGAAARREALTVLAGLFDTLEINVTFYRPPNAKMAESWVKRVEARPTFRFTAKLWQGFTHERERGHAVEEKVFKEGIAPLVDSGKFGALLLQFPHSFKNSTPNCVYLEGLLDRFAAYPLVVEVRHMSWLQDDLLALLDKHNAGFCNVDQPAVGDTAPPTSLVTGGVGYVRWHGRNAENWFRRGAGRDARYDYLYSHEEIREWVERIRLMQGRTKDIFIIANNHYRGQAVANALELNYELTGEPAEVPEDLLRACPRLSSIATNTGSPGMLPL